MISKTEASLKTLGTPSTTTPYYVIDRREPFMYDKADKTTPAGKDVIIGSGGKRFKRLASPLETQVTQLQAQVKELQPEETLKGFEIIYEMAKHTAINIQSIGVRPGESPEVNSKKFEEFIASVAEGNTPSIYVPFGKYQMARAMRLHRRPVYMFGDNGTIFANNSSQFIFPANTEALMIERDGTSMQEPILERLCFMATGKDSLRDGLLIRSRVKLRDITVKGFSHNGFGIWSNMDEGNDSSGSLIQSCHSLENGHDGFFIGRLDANAVLVSNCDSRDNGRYGFNEDSFLGNTYLSCMGHYNKAGDFFVRDHGNASTLYQGCYSEGGNTPSSLGPLSTVIGGTWGSPYIINGVERRGSYMREYEQVK